MSNDEMKDTVKEAMLVLRDESKVLELGLELLPGDPDSSKNILKFLGKGSLGDITKHRNAILAESKSPVPSRPMPEKLSRTVVAVWEETCRIADSEARAKANGLIAAAEMGREEAEAESAFLRLEIEELRVALASERKATEASKPFFIDQHHQINALQTELVEVKAELAVAKKRLAAIDNK